MAIITLEVPEYVKEVAEKRVAREGFADLSELFTSLVFDNDFGAPPELTIDSDEQLEALIKERLDGPFVPMDAADFQRMRDELTEYINGLKATSFND